MPAPLSRASCTQLPWLTPFFFPSFHLLQLFCYFRVSKQNPSCILCHAAAEKNGFAEWISLQMWRRRSKHVFGQRTQISWTACGCMLCSVTPPGTWLDWGREKQRGREGSGGGGVLGKTHRSSLEQTDSVSPRLCTQRQTGKGSGEGVSNLFPELWQSITRACCSADWMLCWMDVLRCYCPLRAWWHHLLMKLITARQRQRPNAYVWPWCHIQWNERGFVTAAK